jgi:methylenetetrahydrofolate reductase (NADPH)
MDGNQLNMDFSAAGEKNRFTEALHGGRFILSIESPSPEFGSSDPAPDPEQIAALEDEVMRVQGMETILAIPDRGRIWRGVEHALELPAANRDRHLVFLSGAGTDVDEAQRLIDLAASAGIKNLVTVSGDAPYGASAKECRRENFTESTLMLEEAAHRGFFAGCVTNPFQYTGFSLWSQFFKLERKLRLGAEFFITQCGWDMLKLQALSWYLRAGSEYTPHLARLMVLSPTRMERVLRGYYPGVRISNEFRRLLERELGYSKAQFESAQYRRLELQVAGCRLMGFSGVQLVGAETPARVRIISGRIRQALEEFTSFPQWLEEYNSYLGSAEMSPIQNGYRLYDRILYRDLPPEPPPGNDLGEPEGSGWERFMLRLREFFFRGADSERAGHARLLKRLLASCRGCPRCRLESHEFVCPENCPKRLSDGPCGGVMADGGCEVDGEECVHVRAVRYAHLRGEFPHPAADVSEKPGC